MRLKAEAARVTTEAARSRAEEAPVAATSRRRAALPSPAAAPPGTRESRFDGVWVGELACSEWRGGPGFQRPQRLVVQNGEVTIELTPSGRRPVRSIGKIDDDDSVELRGARTTPGGRAFDHVVKGRFAGNTFTGQAQPPARPCSLQLSRSTTAR